MPCVVRHLGRPQSDGRGSQPPDAGPHEISVRLPVPVLQSTAPRCRATRVALQACAVADEGEVAALAAGLARVALHQGLAALIGNGDMAGAKSPFNRAGRGFGILLNLAFERRRLPRALHQHQLVGL